MTHTRGIEPITTAFTIASTYGFAPIAAAPLVLPVAHPLINPEPSSVTRSAAATRDVRTQDPLEHHVDVYA